MVTEELTELELAELVLGLEKVVVKGFAGEDIGILTSGFAIALGGMGVDIATGLGIAIGGEDITAGLGIAIGIAVAGCGIVVIVF